MSKSGEWADKLYEPSNELVAVENVNFEGKEPITDEELISINNVDLEYEGNTGGIKALQNINFNIYPGEFICVLGPSGCGKSTLLKILAGFIKPTSGNVKLDGEEISGTDWHRGVVFQNPPLYEWFSVRDNIAFGPKMRGIQKNEYKNLTDEYLKKSDLKILLTKRYMSFQVV